MSARLRAPVYKVPSLLLWTRPPSLQHCLVVKCLCCNFPAQLNLYQQCLQSFLTSNYTFFVSPFQWHFWWPEFWGRTTQPALDNAFCNIFGELIGDKFFQEAFFFFLSNLTLKSPCCSGPEMTDQHRGAHLLCWHMHSVKVFTHAPHRYGGTAMLCWNRAVVAVTVALPTGFAVAA